MHAIRWWSTRTRFGRVAGNYGWPETLYTSLSASRVAQPTAAPGTSSLVRCVFATQPQVVHLPTIFESFERCSTVTRSMQYFRAFFDLFNARLPLVSHLDQRRCASTLVYARVASQVSFANRTIL